jgi:glycerol kinase
LCGWLPINTPGGMVRKTLVGRQEKSMTRYIGAIDQGTTSTRFIVFDRAGAIIASTQMEHRQIYPQPGWVEHDPQELWSNTQAVITAALRDGDLTHRDLAAIGITNQRETTLLWDRTSGMPIHNAVVWQDTRVDPMVAEFASKGGQNRFRAQTGLPLASYFSALKLRWLLDNIPQARRRADAGELAFGTIDTWLLWQLTGKHVTDVTNASRTQLMNLSTLDWDDALLSAFGIPPSVLPRIVPSSAVYGETHGVPIAGILGDQQAALMGQACFSPGEAKNTYGTGCFLLMNTGATPITSTSGLVTTVAWKLGDAPPCYALEGSIAVTGALVQWLRDNLGLIGSSAEIESLAASVADNGDVYFVPAFSGLYAPYWRADARGVVAGLTRYATAGHLARAALEATAYQTYDVIEAMQRDAGIPISTLRADGGMVVNALLMQFQADILDVPVLRQRTIETTALGAAYAAGLAVGYWQDLEDLAANWAVTETWTPTMTDQRRNALLGSWRKAVSRSFDWA